MRISDWSSDVCSSDLAFDLHRVEHLFAHLARGEPARHLDQPIGERRLAVVDMRDNTEISDIFERSCHGSILACQRKFAADSRRANESQSIRAARCLPSCAKRLRCRRKIRTESGRMRHVAVIGSGPAGYYNAAACQKTFSAGARIDILDRKRGG